MLDTLLLALLGGYYYLSTRYKHRYTILRQSSYHLFFRAALWGIMFLVVARLTVFVLVEAAPVSAEWWGFVEERFVPERHRAYAGTAVLALAFGVLLGRVLNFIRDAENEGAPDDAKPVVGSKVYESYRAIEDEGNELERLVTRAFRYEHLLSVTLTTDKYYIGFMANTPEPSRDYHYLKLVPASSGYRDPETKEMRETTAYLEVRQAIEEEAARREAGEDVPGDPVDLDPEDYAVIIPVDKIASLTIFDPEVYRKFQEARQHPAEGTGPDSGETPESVLEDDWS